MALNIKDPETDRLARELATLTGESITRAVKTALADRVAQERRRHGRATAQEVQALVAKLNALPVLDPTPPDDMLYDEFGLPK